jgi:hypothetical protein
MKYGRLRDHGRIAGLSLESWERMTPQNANGIGFGVVCPLFHCFFRTVSQRQATTRPSLPAL